MSQPRRRRRRRRGAQGGARRAAATDETIQQLPGADGQSAEGSRRSRRRRRRRSGSGDGERNTPARSPKLSEDLVRDPNRGKGLVLTATPDDRTLEGVIGDLQSTWGVPQNPQEFRITLKVAEEREGRAPAAPSPDQGVGETTSLADHPRREKAPAAPRIGAASSSGAPAPASEEAPARRKRSRRRRRRGRAQPES